MRNYAVETAKAVERKREYKIRNRAFVLAYLREHPCVDCGNDDVVVLEFDHVNGTKEAEISRAINRAFSIERLTNEIAKCEVVCANCHKRRSYERTGCYKLEE